MSFVRRRSLLGRTRSTDSLSFQPANSVFETLQRRVDRNWGRQVPGVRVGNPDAAHPGTSRSLQPGGRVFENDAGLGGHAEPLRGE